LRTENRANNEMEFMFIVIDWDIRRQDLGHLNKSRQNFEKSQLERASQN
jgi:hypothetical protein